MKRIYKLSMFIVDSRPEEAPRVFVYTHTLFSIIYVFSLSFLYSQNYLIRPCTCQRCRPFLLCKFSTSNSPSFRLCITQISGWNWSPTETIPTIIACRQVAPWHRDTFEVCCVCLDLPWMGQRISNPAMPSWEWIRPRVLQRSVRSEGLSYSKNPVVDWTNKGKVMKRLGHLAAKFQKWNDCAMFLKRKLRSLNTF